MLRLARASTLLAATLLAGCGAANGRLGETCFDADPAHHVDRGCSSGLTCAMSTSSEGETHGVCEDATEGLPTAPAPATCKPSIDGEPCAPPE
jgi:hypothetical protein